MPSTNVSKKKKKNYPLEEHNHTRFLAPNLTQANLIHPKFPLRW